MLVNLTRPSSRYLLRSAISNTSLFRTISSLAKERLSIMIIIIAPLPVSPMWRLHG